MATLPAFSPGENLDASDNARLRFTASVAETKSIEVSGFIAATYSGFSADLSTQFSDLRTISFSPDGANLYVVGLGSDSVFQYVLSTPWDISTVSYSGNQLSVAAQDGTPGGVTVSSAGDSLYVSGGDNDSVFQYDMSTAWDLSTASYSGNSMSAAAQDTTLGGLFFKSDGTSLYLMGLDNDSVFQYDLTVAWDISTASYSGNSLAVSDTSPIGIWMPSDGANAYVTGFVSDAVVQYDLSTPWDISTGTHSGREVSARTSGLATNGSGVFFSDDFKSMYVSDNVSNQVHQFTVPDSVPENFESMDSLSWTVEYTVFSHTDDTVGLDIRIMSGATVLAAADDTGTFAVVDANITSSSDQTLGPVAFSYVNTTATRQQWVDAVCELRQNYTRNMGGDGAFLDVDWVEFTGTYTAASDLVVANVLDQQPSVLTPGVLQEQIVEAPTLAVAETVLAPEARIVTTVQADVLSSPETLHAPTVIPDQAVQANVLTQPPTILQPSVVMPQRVGVNLLTISPTVLDPGISADAALLLPKFIQVRESILEPQVIDTNQDVAAHAVTSPATVLSPTARYGQSVTTALIDSSVQLLSPRTHHSTAVDADLDLEWAVTSTVDKNLSLAGASSATLVKDIPRQPTRHIRSSTSRSLRR